MKWIRHRRPLVPETGGAPSSEEILRQLERVVAHPIFRKSENLRSILTFLVQQSIASPGVNHKEHEIATCALGRSDDFDPRLDSTVRVHTARLRTKLGEYYASDGENDPVTFEIPKGAYELNTRLRAEPQTLEGEDVAAERPRVVARSRLWTIAVWGWIVAVAAASATLLLWTDARSRSMPPSLGMFWSDFMKPGEETALVFSTPRMAGSAADGLRFAGSEPVPPQLLVENYAGTGEVYGVGALSGLFAQYWRPVRIKRGRLLTWDDARQENLVFVGGPSVNSHLRELPALERFRFASTAADGSFLQDTAIDDIRSHTQPGARYGHSPRPYTFDHAVIARMRLASNRKMLLLAGTTTLGTQAAVDFVVREETMKALLAALKLSRPDSVPGFEALLSVKVSDGVPVHSRIVAVHLRQ